MASFKRSAQSVIHRFLRGPPAPPAPTPPAPPPSAPGSYSRSPGRRNGPNERLYSLHPGLDEDLPKHNFLPSPPQYPVGPGSDPIIYYSNPQFHPGSYETGSVVQGKQKISNPDSPTHPAFAGSRSGSALSSAYTADDSAYYGSTSVLKSTAQRSPVHQIRKNEGIEDCPQREPIIATAENLVLEVGEGPAKQEGETKELDEIDTGGRGEGKKRERSDEDENSNESEIRSPKDDENAPKTSSTCDHTVFREASRDTVTEACVDNLTAETPTNASSEEEEELTSTSSASILYLLYLAVAHGRGLSMLEDSHGLWDSSEDSTSSSGGDGNGRMENCHSSGGLSGSASSSSGNRRTNYNSKKGLGDDEADEGGSGRGPQRPRYNARPNKALRLRLACPFGKGDPIAYPSCILKNRQDLSGVKEHLRRNHFGGTIPAVKTAKTWLELFQICIPDWPAGVPVPSPHFNPYEIYISSRKPPNTPRSRVLSPSRNGKETFESISSQSRLADSFSHATERHIKKPLPPAALGMSKENAQVISKNAVTTESSTIPSLSDPLNVPVDTLNLPFAEQDIRRMGFFSGALLGLGPDPTPMLVEELFREAVPFIESNLNIGPDAQMDDGLSTGTQNSSGLGSSNTSISMIQQTFPLDPTPINFPTHQEARELGLNTLGMNQFHVPQRITGLNQTQRTDFYPQIGYGAPPPLQTQTKRYLLCITRNPCLRSSEAPGVKKFRFEGVDDFIVNFEPWMKTHFYDPGFCWNIFEIQNPLTGERFVDAEGVFGALEFIWLAYRTSEAAFFLVPKQAKT